MVLIIALLKSGVLPTDELICETDDNFFHNFYHQIADLYCHSLARTALSLKQTKDKALDVNCDVTNKRLVIERTLIYATIMAAS